MTTTLTADGSIEIPEEFRRADALEAGQPCEIERLAAGDYRVRVQSKGLGPHSAAEWLLSCPERGWFQPAERVETTNDLPEPPFS